MIPGFINVFIKTLLIAMYIKNV